jgi:ABC-type branched-subunit amino acid transport system substrate-binding protein
MGIVYLALAQGPAGFAKLKVIKRLRPDLGGEPTAVQMFLEEGRLSARLNHPNVVQTNEVGFDGRHYFLEMEYLEGQAFSALTRRAARSATGGVLPLPIAAYVLAQTLAGLHYAHELTDHDGSPLAVVHRDVSPHNVFVTYDGLVKVLDFGIAKAAGSSSETKTGFVKGKVTYMAPEQVARQPLDRRVDVFAVGVMLWEALAGKRLWGDLDDFEIFLKLRSEAIPSPATMSPDAPEPLVRICMRALAREPDGRYATATEMQRELEAWLESGSRVGGRELSECVSTLFAEERKATKAEIEAQMKAAPTTESAVGVPVLRPEMPVSVITGSGMGAASTTLGEGTRVRQERQIRGLRTIALMSLGIAVVASGAAGIVALRNKRAKAVAAPLTEAAAPVAKACSNRACSEAHGGEAWVCRASDHACVPVASEDCKAMYEPRDLLSDDAVWLGAIFPMTGPDGDDWGKMNMDGVDFARSEIAQATAPLRKADGSSGARPIALVGCNDVADPVRAARHLVEDVGVPAVIGFGAAEEVVSVASNVLIPAGVLTVASMTPSPVITRIPQPSDVPRMVWRTTFATDAIAEAAALMVHESLEPRAHRAPTRVSLVHREGPAADSFAGTFYRRLIFNGRAAVDNGRDYQEVTVGPRTLEEGRRVGKLVGDAQPSIVFLVSWTENVETIVQTIEDSAAPDRRPIYVIPNDGTELLKGFIGRSADRRHRVFGISSLSSALPNARFVIRYNQARNAQVTRSINPGVSYDAFYLLAYAAFALPPGANVTGRTLADAFGRLVPPGTALEAGPASVLDAVSTLAATGRVDLDGTQGPLDFDLKTGEALSDLSLLCPAVGDGGRASGADVESGVVYRAKSRRVEGSVRCP